jgi:hypothetical protein
VLANATLQPGQDISLAPASRNFFALGPAHRSSGGYHLDYPGRSKHSDIGGGLADNLESHLPKTSIWSLQVITPTEQTKAMEDAG